MIQLKNPDGSVFSGHFRSESGGISVNESSKFFRAVSEKERIEKMQSQMNELNTSMEELKTLVRSLINAR